MGLGIKDNLDVNIMTITQIQDEIVAEFEFFEDWMERYEYIIELGKSLDLLEEEFKTAANLIGGCQSQAWLHATLEKGKVIYKADADAILGKGVIALLLRVYSNQTPQTILGTDIDFVARIGLKENLSPTRANGLVAMIKQIKLYALAFNHN